MGIPTDWVECASLNASNRFYLEGVNSLPCDHMFELFDSLRKGSGGSHVSLPLTYQETVRNRFVNFRKMYTAHRQLPFKALLNHARMAREATTPPASLIPADPVTQASILSWRGCGLARGPLSVAHPVGMQSVGRRVNYSFTHAGLSHTVIHPPIQQIVAEGLLCARCCFRIGDKTGGNTKNTGPPEPTRTALSVSQ